MANVDMLRQRRNELASLWEAAFEEARANNRPAKHEMSPNYVENFALLGCLMFSEYEQPNHRDEYQRLHSFLDTMDVGGYRMGRNRYRGAWACAFIRNVQYSAMKYVPRNMDDPEIILLSLVVRANMERACQWVQTVLAPGERDMSRLNQFGVRATFIDSPIGTRLRVSYRGFEHTILMEEVVSFFDRTFDGDFRGENIPEPTNSRRMANDFSGDSMVLPFEPHVHEGLAAPDAITGLLRT